MSVNEATLPAAAGSAASCGDDRAAHRVADQMDPVHADRVEEAEDGLCEGLDGPVPDILRRRPVPRQVEGVGNAVGGDRLLHEQPRVLVTAVAVHEQHRIVPGLGVAEHGV